METDLYCSFHRCWGRLNRTMQYGNLEKNKEKKTDISGLNRTMQYGNDCGRDRVSSEKKFKSYYVVWKLFSIKGKAYTMSRLNRTMQYGNFKILF